MGITFRTGALVLALLVGTALTAAPAMADRDHHDWDRKSWKHYKHGHKHHHDRYAHRGRGHGWKRSHSWDRRYGRYGWYGYRSPRYGYGWPYYYRPRPGFSVEIY
jgi:hypothetical protein